jgi:hypothetical protein
MSFFEFPHTRTYDSDLGWLIKDYKTLDEFKAAVKAWIEQTQPTIDELKKLYTDIMNGNFPDEMKVSLLKWTTEVAEEVIGKAIKIVTFGLENGYLVAYIPESWTEITFGTTGLDDFPAGYDYGHLTLNY